MASPATGGPPAGPLTCPRARGPVRVDGRLDQPAWEAAPRTARFADAVTGRVAFFDTRAALLWDDRCLYVGFWVEERDVWTTGQERRGLQWAENAVEVYLAGPGAHYQLSVSPGGRTEELLFIWKDAYARGGRYDVPEFDLAARRPMVAGGDNGPHHPRGMRWLFSDWHLPGLEAAVRVDGTLDQRLDLDRGWTAEIALPWEGLARLLPDGRPVPQPGLRVALARSQVIDQRRSRHTAVWSWPTLGEGGLHAPERYLEIALAA